MLKIFGSPHCPDCVICKEDLDRAGVPYVYMDITGNLMFLKKFLKLREGTAFDAIRAKGQIGIPCILRQDDTITFDWKEFL
jgi:glutaredoxin-related protein